MVRVRTVLTGWPGAPGLNTFYFIPGVGTDDVSCDEGFQAVTAFWEDVAPLFPNEFTATTDQIVDFMSSATGELIGSFTSPGANVSIGLETGNEFLPAQTMAVLSLRTTGTINGKRVRGRSYIGPMQMGATGPTGQLANDTIADLAAAGNTLKTPQGNETTLGVWHRPTTVGGTDGSLHIVSDVLVRPVWGHLKTRRV